MKRLGSTFFRSCFPENFGPFARALANVPLCACTGVWMGGTHPCSHAFLPMRWSVDGRHPPLLTCLSAHALERGWESPTCVHEESMAEENEDEDEDIVCVHRLNGDASDGNDIVICEGAHSAMVGWHRLCLTPPLQESPTPCWLYPECVSTQVGADSSLGDPNYAPSTGAFSTSGSCSSASASTSDSGADSNSSSSSGSDPDSDCDTITDSNCYSAGKFEFD